MDRRDFFRRSGSNLGDWVKENQLGWLGSVVASLVGAPEPNKQPGTAGATSARTLLRTGEPMNREGQAFGGPIQALTGIIAPDAAPGRRLLIVCGHGGDGESLVGISSVELLKTEKGWEHNVASTLNRRWDGTTGVAIEGAVLEPGKPAHWHRDLTPGAGPIRAAAALPWQTVLCGDEWPLEINPVNGAAIKRFAMGRVRPVAIELVVLPGLPTAFYLLGLAGPDEGRLFKFITLQRFDSQRFDANATALSIGSLWVADLEAGRWVALTAGLESEPARWEASMRDPHAAASGIATIHQPQSLAWDRRTRELSVSHAGAISVLKEEGDAHSSRQFGYGLRTPGNLRAPAEKPVPTFRLPLGESVAAAVQEGQAALVINELASR